MINALVSHEMRNPLNSISSMILKLKLLLETLYTNVNNPHLNGDGVKKEVLRFADEMFEACDVLQSSSKLLSFCVDDMLSLG